MVNKLNIKYNKMELQNFLMEHWAKIGAVILIAVLIVQKMKLERAEEALKNLSYLKSRAEFYSQETQTDDRFLNQVFEILLAEFSDKQLEKIRDEQTRKIKRISRQTIIEHPELQELDRCRLTRSYVVEEIIRRKK